MGIPSNNTNNSISNMPLDSMGNNLNDNAWNSKDSNDNMEIANDNSNSSFQFNKTQLTKLLIHSLKEMGYDKSAFTLQEESGGIQIESSIVQHLFQLIKFGQYELINLEILLKLPLKNNINLLDFVNRSDFSVNSIISNNFNSNSMKISNIIEDNTENNSKNNTITLNINESIQNFESQFKNFNQLFEVFQDNNDFLIHFKKTIQIMMLIIKQFFIELILSSNTDSIIVAVRFLRNVIKDFIQLWDQILSLIDEWDTLTNTSNNVIILESNQSFNYTPDQLLKELSSYITNPSILNEITQNANNISKLRNSVIDDISNYINPNDLVPKGRLLTLLREAIQYQKSQNLLNVFDDDLDEDNDVNNDKNTTDYSKFSLLQDNISLNQNFKFTEQKTLVQNADEIWYLQFSPDGRYLASATADSLTDRKILIYDVLNDFEVYKVLAGNSQCILYLSFSPDGKYIVSCPFNENANIYDIHSSGEIININSENAKIQAEIIQPLYSFEINSETPSSTSADISSSNHEDNHHQPRSSFSNESSPASTTPMDTSMSSSSIHHNHVSISNATRTSNTTITSPRIWCCDWFHTENHKGKFILGSPDREVVIFDIDTKSVIFSISKNYNRRHNKKKNNTHDSHEDTFANFNTEDLFPRIHDLKISFDDSYLLLMTHQGEIDVYDLSKFPDNNSLTISHYTKLLNFNPKKLSRLHVQKNMTCISLAQPNPKTRIVDPLLSSLVLVNLQFNEMQLWNFKENLLIQKYFGQKQEQFIIRSCFGYNNKIVISGSEDGKIYIWDRAKGNILSVLSGHSEGKPIAAGNSKGFSKNCNVVAWNPTDKHTFVSGGDDGIIKVWKIIKD